MLEDHVMRYIYSESREIEGGGGGGASAIFARISRCKRVTCNMDMSASVIVSVIKGCSVNTFLAANKCRSCHFNIYGLVRIICHNWM